MADSACLRGTVEEVKKGISCMFCPVDRCHRRHFTMIYLPGTSKRAILLLEHDCPCCPPMRKVKNPKDTLFPKDTSLPQPRLVYISYFSYISLHIKSVNPTNLGSGVNHLSVSKLQRVDV